MVDQTSKKKRKRVESNDVKQTQTQGKNGKTGTPAQAAAATPARATQQLSAIAVRKLALAQEAERAAASQSTNLSEQLQTTASSPSPSSSSSSGNDEEVQISADIDLPLASTSQLPSQAKKERRRTTQRYYDAVPPSSSTHNDNAQDTDMSFDKSAAEEEDTEGESSSAAVSTSRTPRSHAPTPRRSKRRRRGGEDSRSAHFDPSCVSTWRPVHLANYFPIEATPEGAGKAVVLAMHPGETILAKGVYSLTILRGSIKLNSALFSSSSSSSSFGSLPIFAPTTHSLPVIHAQAPSHSPVTNTLPHEPISLASPIEFEHPLEDYPVVILLQDRQTGIEGIEKVCRIAGMPIPGQGMFVDPDRSDGMQSVIGGTFEVITSPERDLTQTILPENWRAVLDDLVRPTPSADAEGYMPNNDDDALVCIVQGPKGTGKSTFSKMLANVLLTQRTSSQHTRVAYLDTDIGQTELGPSGVMSLHLLDSPLIGPSFTHLHRQAVHSHYLGAITPKNNPSLYLSAIQDLLNTFCSLLDDLESESAIPLVINTQGWTKGLGADLLAELHQMVTQALEGRQASIKIFDFTSSTPQFGSGYDTSVSSAQTMPTIEGAQIIFLQPIFLPEYSPVRLTPADLRTLSLISYLHLSPSSFPPAYTSSSSSRCPSWDFATSLVRKRPYEVPWDTFHNVRLLGSEGLPYEEILRALDVSLVALVEITDVLSEASEEETAPVPGKLAYRPHDPASVANGGNCLGLGIIRAVDTSSSTFHILTPLPIPPLERVNALHKGDIELPTVLMVDYAAGGGSEGNQEEGVCGVEWKEVPYLEGRGEALQGVGNAKRRVRRNVMRRSQF